MKTRMSNSIIYLQIILFLFLGIRLNAQSVPSDLMRNCDQWKITYPTGEEDKTLCGEANNEFFFVNNDGDGMVFFAPVRSDNGTTPNSSYIRSELRERTEDGGSDIYWTTEGRHVLYVEQAITHLPIVKPHLVATQIHGDKVAGIDDALVLRLEGSHLFLSFNGEKLRSDVTIKTDYVLGTKHEVMFEVIDDKHYVYYSEDGNLWNAYTSGDASQYLVKDNGESILMDLNYDQSYFKVGNYTQSNPEKEGAETDNPDNYGEVVVYDFIVEHGGDGYTNTEETILAPYELQKMQDYLALCKLQAPTSTTEATPDAIMNNYKSATFYVAENDKVAFTMSGASQRSELRNETNWYVGVEDQTLHTNVKIAEQTCEQLTFIQIHDDANVGAGPNKPLLRVYRHTTKNSVDHIWAVVKTDATGLNDKHYDLGATPNGYFDCDVLMEADDLVIEVDGTELVRHNVSYWTFPNYWKNGVYLQDIGEATTYFNELTLTTSTNETVAVSNVSLSPSSVTLAINETKQLTASINPINATNNNVSYSSNNTSVATVDDNGLVTAIAEGTAIITVLTEDGNKSSTSTFTVNGIVSSRLIPADLMRNCKGWKITYPTGEEQKQLCDEDNNEFFFVNGTENGIVFKAPVRSDNGTTPNSSYIRSELRERTEDGSADIYWTTQGKHVLYVEQAITHLPLVKNHLVATQIHGDKAAGIDDALVLRLEGQHLFLSFNGEKLRSDVTIKTDYVLGTKHEVMFEVIDDKHYVYYSEDGNLWEAYSQNNAAQYLVKDNGESILMDLNYDQSYFKVGNYTQSNPDKEGTETNDPENYGEVVVYDFIVEHGETETQTVTGVEVSPLENTISVGGSVQLLAIVSPTNATNQAVSFSSSENSIATVSENGSVTGVSEGTVIITVTTNDGNYKAYAEVIVKDVPQGLLNVAYNKTVTTSGTPELNNPASALVDENTDTRISVLGMPQTITIDLGANYDLSYSELVFHNERAYQYTISVATSENGPYNEIVDRSLNSTSGTVDSPLTDYFTAVGRFVQIEITGANIYDGEWVSISEFRVFGEESLITSTSESLGNDLSVFPIPARNVLNYSVNQSVENIEIIDLRGNVVLSQELNNTTGRVDVSNLKNGMYLLKVIGEVTYVKRFNKE